MKIHNPLDKILNSEIKTKLVRFMCRTDAEWSGRQIAKEIKVSPASCHKALRELNGQGVLLLRSIGKSFLYRMNKKNALVADILKPLYQAEDRIPQLLFGIIRKNLSPGAKRSIVSLVVFGSIARKEEKARSDVDVLVVLTSGKDKNTVGREFDKINEKISPRFGNTISPYLQSIKEFRLKYKRKHPLVKNILNAQNLLFGKPLRELL